MTKAATAGRGGRTNPLVVLSSAQNDILAGLYQHRLCSTSQLLAIHGGLGNTRRWLQGHMVVLEKRGYVARVLGRPPAREALWFVTAEGAEAVEAGGYPARPYKISAEKAAGPLQAHTLAVNDVGIAFLEASRRLGHECGPLSWEHEVAHPIGDGRAAEAVIPDAVLHYTAVEAGGEIVLCRFVELDRATMDLALLEAKLHNYARLYRQPKAGGGRSGHPAPSAWRQRYPAFPKVMVVMCGRPEAVLQRRMNSLMARYRPDPTLDETRDLAVSITTLAALRQEGPFAPVFWRPAAPGAPVDVLGRPGR